MDEKKRKSPTPQGLTLRIPLAETQELQTLATFAGHSTKEQLEVAALDWLLTQGLAWFRAHLVDQGQKRFDEVRSTVQPAPVPAQGGLNKAGGISLNPAADHEHPGG